MVALSADRKPHSDFRHSTSVTKMNSTSDPATLARAADAISQCDAILIGAGAGMGVDSGLPDFRGDQGFWKAYPPFKGKRFSDISNPIWFRKDPAQAWGFFGHRLNLYRDTVPHAGFEILKKWTDQKESGHFVFTSNVDGHFQRAGFDPDTVLECHGAIDFMQCAEICCNDVWSGENVQVSVDLDTIRATSDFPNCPHCGKLARPNIMMFGDYDWLPNRFEQQAQRYSQWLQSIASKRLAVIEFGAGNSIPTVRHECESRGGKLIRVNPRDFEVPIGSISIPLGALEAIEKIDTLL